MAMYLITHSRGKIKGNIELPGSKSIANRLLMIRELAGSQSQIEGLPDNEDTILMLKLLAEIQDYPNPKDSANINAEIQDYPNPKDSANINAEIQDYPNPKGSLNFSINKQEEETGNLSPFRAGVKMISSFPPFEVNCGNTGTVFRFLTSFLSIKPGNWLLTGSERMLERPIGALVEALRSLGADIKYADKTGYPPLLIKGKTLAGGEVFINSNESSQFITSLLMISPLLAGGIKIHLQGEKVSEPYIDMTLALMQKCGVKVNKIPDGYSTPQQEYIFNNQIVEKDWSAASCWFETVALANEGELLLKGLIEDSLQGDKELVNIYQKLGVKSTFTADGLLLTKDIQSIDFLDFNLQNTPDLMPSLAVALAGKELKGKITGIEHLRIKESDRISSIEQELCKAGYIVESHHNNLNFNQIKTPFETPPILASHDDHRIVMALAPLALKINNLIINDSRAVNKSYPGFWQQLQNIGFQVVEI